MDWLRPHERHMPLGSIHMYKMSAERKSIPVSLPPELVEELDRLVEEGKFGSRSEALRYGARLVTHEEATKRLHQLTQTRAREQVEDRLERKRDASE